MITPSPPSAPEQLHLASEGVGAVVLSLCEISILPCLLEIQLGLHKARIVPYSGSFRPFRQRVSRVLKWTGSTGMDWYFLLSLPLPALMMLVGMQKLASWRCCRQKVHHLQYLVRVCQRCFYVKTWTHLVKVLSETSLRCSNCIYRLEYAHDSIMTLQVQGQVQVTTHDSFPIWFWALASVNFFWSATATNGVTARASASTHHRWPTVLESISRRHPPPQILSFWHRCCTIHGHILQGLAAYDILHRCSPSQHYRASLLASPVSQTLEVGPEMQASL